MLENSAHNYGNHYLPFTTSYVANYPTLNSRANLFVSTGGEAESFACRSAFHDESDVTPFATFFVEYELESIGIAKTTKIADESSEFFGCHGVSLNSGGGTKSLT